MKSRNVFLLLPILLIPIVGCSNIDLSNESSIESISSFEPSIESVSSFEPSIESVSSFEPSSKEVPLNNKETFIFLTDPHVFRHQNRYLDLDWFDYASTTLNNIYHETSSNFILCGGDILCNGDSHDEAIYKLQYFSKKTSLIFDNFYLIVGNHDTNYQGDTFNENGNYLDCMLTTKELNDALFNGRSNYYLFETYRTKYYCFDSGIDWDSEKMDSYKWEQIDWFANDLLFNDKAHITIFIHIALMGKDKKQLSSFMDNIGIVISAFNKKETLTINNWSYDFSFSYGHVDFIQAGHEHKDIECFTCGGVPLIITRNSYPIDEVMVTYQTFDCVIVDYNENVVLCNRYGDGENRLFHI